METISLGKFLSFYHRTLKPKGIRLGQALSTTFFKPTNIRCEVSAELCDDHALDKFNKVIEQANWTTAALHVVDRKMLEVN